MDAVNELLLSLRLHFPLHVFFKLMPKIFDRVYVGRLCWCSPPIYLFSCRKFCANRDVCLGSLSAMNLWLVGIPRAINGSNVRSSMFTYSGAFIIQSKMHIWVGPFLLMPAQTWTYVGCVALREKEIINKSIPLFCVLKLYAPWLWFRGLPLLSAARSSV